MSARGTHARSSRIRTLLVAVALVLVPTQTVLAYTGFSGCPATTPAGGSCFGSNRWCGNTCAADPAPATANCPAGQTFSCDTCGCVTPAVGCATPSTPNVTPCSNPAGGVYSDSCSASCVCPVATKLVSGICQPALYMNQSNSGDVTVGGTVTANSSLTVGGMTTLGGSSLGLGSGQNLIYGVVTANTTNGNLLLLQNGGGNDRLKVDPTGAITAAAGITAGSSKFQVNATGDLTKINNVTYAWPSAQGSSNAVLTNNGSGTLSWAAPVTGSTITGTAGYLPKFATATTLGNSLVYDNGSNVGIGTANPPQKLSVVGSVGISGANKLNFGYELNNPPYILAKWWDNNYTGLEFHTFVNAVDRPALVLTPGGGVGIGTDAPDYLVTVAQNSTNAADTAIININNASTTTRLWTGLRLARGNEPSNPAAAKEKWFIGMSDSAANNLLRFRINNEEDAATLGQELESGNDEYRFRMNGRVIAGQLETSELKLTSAGFGVGKVLTSDASGLASWATPASGVSLTPTPTTNYLSKFTSATSLGNSQIIDNGTNVSIAGNLGVGIVVPVYPLDVASTLTAAIPGSPTNNGVRSVLSTSSAITGSPRLNGMEGRSTYSGTASGGGALLSNGMYGVADTTGTISNTTLATGGYFESIGNATHASGALNKYGVWASAQGSADQNVALYATASGATTNYAIMTNGDVAVKGITNLQYSGVAGGKVALQVNGTEALWSDGTSFSWGYGNADNYFADPVGIGGNVRPKGKLQVYGDGTANDADLKSTATVPTTRDGQQGYIIVGDTAGKNIAIDNNEIMARDYATATGTSTLFLQNDGGLVDINGDLSVAGNATINDTYVGDVGHGGNWAGLAHKNAIGTASYGLLMHTSGEHTYMNIKGGSGYMGFRVDNGNVMTIANNGDIAMNGKHAFRGNDAWLRLNQNGEFTSGVHTPGLFAPKSLSINQWSNPGDGNLYVDNGIGVGRNPISGYGIAAQSTGTGGYFNDTDDGSYAYLGYSAYGIYTNAEGLFYDSVGIGARNTASGLFVNLGGDVTSSNDTSGYVVIGSTIGANIAIDNNEIMARNGGTTTLYIQNDGGWTDFGGSLDVAGQVYARGQLYTEAGIYSEDDLYAVDQIYTENKLYAEDGIQLYNASAIKPNGGLWVAPSDARTKKDVSDFLDGLDLLERMRPVNYTYNGLGETPEGLHGIGFIAQELREVAPYMVSIDRRKLHPTDDAAIDMLTVDASALPLITMNAVRELHAIIQDQATTIESLEEKFDAQQKEIKELKDLLKSTLKK